MMYTHKFHQIVISWKKMSNGGKMHAEKGECMLQKEPCDMSVNTMTCDK